MLTFDPGPHVYRLDGRVIPHVTGVLSILSDFSMVKPDVLENARQKGVAVHKLVEMRAQGIDCTLPAWMQRVDDYWKQFCAETGFKLIASEQRVFHPKYQYAGTLDLVCELPGTNNKGAGIIDVKRSFMSGRAIGLQTAAYQHAYEAGGGTKINWRAALRLREDGPYRLAPYNEQGDFSQFIACLAVARIKEQLK